MSLSVSNSAKIFAFEMAYSCELFGRENAGEREGETVGCTCGPRACLHQYWLPCFAALKQSSSLGIGAMRNVSGEQR